MGRLDPKHSDAQREAVIRNMLERGQSAPATVEAAAAGELGVPAFTIGETTCRTFARAARDARREDVRADAGAQSTEIGRAVAEATIARVKALDAPTGKDLSALQIALRLIGDADRAAARDAPAAPSRPANGEPSPLVLALIETQAEQDKAIAEGRPCGCDEPLLADFGDDGTCISCRSAVRTSPRIARHRQPTAPNPNRPRATVRTRLRTFSGNGARRGIARRR